MALVTALLAALVALTGYWINQSMGRRERRGRVYAEAIEALYEYQELPYRILRRPASDGAARSELSTRVSDILSRVRFYRSLLEMDSPVVGLAYSMLYAQTASQGREHRRAAWVAPLVTSDAEMATAYFPYDNDAEYALCLMAMRRELLIFGFLFRRTMCQRITAQARTRRPMDTGLPESGVHEESPLSGDDE